MKKIDITLYMIRQYLLDTMPVMHYRPDSIAIHVNQNTDKFWYEYRRGLNAMRAGYGSISHTLRAMQGKLDPYARNLTYYLLTFSEHNGPTFSEVVISTEFTATITRHVSQYTHLINSQQIDLETFETLYHKLYVDKVYAR